MKRRTGDEKTQSRKDTDPEFCPHCSQTIPEPVRLQERQIFIGLLQDVIKQEDCVLAVTRDALIELPKSRAPKLWALVGERVQITRLDGKCLVAAWRAWT